MALPVDSGAHPTRILTILYATETGHAQDAADRIAIHCRRIHFKCRVVSMDAYPLSDIVSEHLIIFVVSTTGTGKEPRSMTPLWNMLLRSDLPPDLFEDLEYAVFGLGDTAYEKFCWPAKKLDRRLKSLGAAEICPRGEGDDQHPLGIDGALYPWMRKLTEALLDLYPLPPGLKVLPDDSLPPPRVVLHEATGETISTDNDPDRITARDWYQDVRHIELYCNDDISYEPGDVAVIHPEAMPDDVDAFLTIVGWGNIADDPIRIERAVDDQTLPDHLPSILTIRAIFTRYLDINAVPRRSFFNLLQHFTSDEREKEKLSEFVSEEGADELYEYCQRVRRTIREVLEEFRHVRIPKNYIFDLFPPLRPRQFSIASSLAFDSSSGTLMKSICDTLRIGLQSGLLSLPDDPKTPVICVGPGTGVAPMRALIEKRIHIGSQLNTLYFGCRSSLKDQHYHSEWTAYAAQGDLTYRVACSRDGPEGIKKTYVQDLIVEDKTRIWELVDKQKAWVYISGSANKMPAGVRGAIIKAAQSEGGMGEEEARVFVSRMEKDGRLMEECWS
ncbi:hypothetical protein EW146_g3703 [Bondarzewia mesenterica]|uniref:NADPH-dependent diflavin oxidoreductase 1 n=1 Tax=Bondarzewia mesenterica TaxID=1095465 RepID=A0A4S4LYY8_9AGAM|nr:hypothetical protein EW146_g3703 [Bondarzewia mesenterica]